MGDRNLNVYECPLGCKAQGGKPIAATVRGWKKHMTRQHGEWTEDQLKTALGATATDSEAGRALFLSEADGVTDAAPPAQGPDATGAEPEAKKVVEMKTDATSRKLSAKFDKFQKKVTAQLTRAVANAVNEKGEEWAMNEEDREMFSESLENCMEVLDVQFNIAPIAVQLTNPLWVLLMPLLALLLIFVPKALKNLPKGEEHATDEKSGPEVGTTK